MRMNNNLKPGRFLRLCIAAWAAAAVIGLGGCSTLTGDRGTSASPVWN